MEEFTWRKRTWREGAPKPERRSGRPGREDISGGCNVTNCLGRQEFLLTTFRRNQRRVESDLKPTDGTTCTCITTTIKETRSEEAFPNPASFPVQPTSSLFSVSCRSIQVSNSPMHATENSYFSGSCKIQKQKTTNYFCCTFSQVRALRLRRGPPRPPPPLRTRHVLLHRQPARAQHARAPVALRAHDPRSRAGLPRHRFCNRVLLRCGDLPEGCGQEERRPNRVV
jgi:hypothetical protein